jgi:hypothetical protein
VRVVVAPQPPPNVAPTATFSNTGPVDEGSSFQLSLDGAFDPSSADTAAGFTYSFDCGDGSGYGAFSSSATATCPTNDNGTRHVAARIRDKDGGTTAYTDTVAVHNVAPTGHLSNDGPVDERSAATIAFTSPSDASSVDAASLHFAFSCAGADLSGTTYAAASATNTAGCTFPDNGMYTVTGVVIDKDGGATTDTTTVQVNNVPPTVTAAADQSGDEGTSTAFAWLLHDPKPTAPEVTVNWATAPATPPQHVRQGRSAPARTPTRTARSETVTVTVIDKDGAATAAPSPSPSATCRPPARWQQRPGDEGSAATIMFTNLSDPSGRRRRLHYAFSCSNGICGGPQRRARHNSATAPSPTRAPHGRRRDHRQGRHAADSSSVHVNNAAGRGPSARPATRQPASFSPGRSATRPRQLVGGRGTGATARHTRCSTRHPPARSALQPPYDDNGSRTATVTSPTKTRQRIEDAHAVINVAPSATWGTTAR